MLGIVPLGAAPLGSGIFSPPGPPSPGFVNGVNLLPATGEFTYATTARIGQRVSEPALTGINFYFAGGPPKTDYSYAIDQLQAAFPACTTVAVVCAWFGNSIAAGSCQIYPSTTYQNNGSVINPATGLPWPAVPHAFEFWNGSSYTPDMWRVSSLNETTVGLLNIPTSGGTFIYGGTPSDQSIVGCIADLKARGLRVVFYPFILMTAPGEPWRGRITYPGADVSSAATAAVTAFLGGALVTDFVQDFVNNTVAYNGPAGAHNVFDFTFRRFILHYANLCVVAGGVDLFLIGSELRGLETIRGPGWTPAGTTDGSGNAIWDYPFVAGLVQLAADVRTTFTNGGLTKAASAASASPLNWISYAADWSSWMGWQHPGANPPLPLPVIDGQWPHLDQLWASPNIDFVCFDNYMPLSDWTTGDGSPLTNGQSNNLDIANWNAPAPTTWPPGPSNMSGLGLTGQATINSLAYLKANIEGGEKFNWFYFNSNNLGRGNDPLGSDLQVSIPGNPTDDRLTQTRHQFFANQQILGNKQLRWWWNNQHFALYDNQDGHGDAPKGPQTEWVICSKSIVFTEYGFPATDKCTNQPNLFYSAASSESGTAYWSAWRNVDGGGFLPVQDQNLQLLALQALYEYWFTDTPSRNPTVAGVAMIQPTFCSVWNWDARPFPTFPRLSGTWGDAGNWAAGNWLNGKGPFLTPPVPDAPVPPGVYPAFPVLRGLGWSVRYSPGFVTGAAEHSSGRASRFSRMSAAVWDIELTVDLLTMDVIADFQTLASFYESTKGQELPFTYPVDTALGIGSPVNCRFADDFEDFEEFMNRLWEVQSIKLRTVKGE